MISGEALKTSFILTSGAHGQTKQMKNSVDWIKRIYCIVIKTVFFGNHLIGRFLDFVRKNFSLTGKVWFFVFLIELSINTIRETYSEPSQTSKMNVFAVIVNGLMALNR